MARLPVRAADRQFKRVLDNLGAFAAIDLRPRPASSRAAGTEHLDLSTVSVALGYLTEHAIAQTSATATCDSEICYRKLMKNCDDAECGSQYVPRNCVFHIASRSRFVIDWFLPFFCRMTGLKPPPES